MLESQAWADHLDWVDVLERYIKGESIRQIAEDYVIEEWRLRAALIRDPVRAEMWQEAQAQRAWSAADRIIDIANALQPHTEKRTVAQLDSKDRVVYDGDRPVMVEQDVLVIASNEQIRAAETLIKALQWTASRLNPGTFGDRVSADVSIRVTHEEALKQIIDAEVPEHGQ